MTQPIFGLQIKKQFDLCSLHLNCFGFHASRDNHTKKKRKRGVLLLKFDWIYHYRSVYWPVPTNCFVDKRKVIRVFMPMSMLTSDNFTPLGTFAFWRHNFLNRLDEHCSFSQRFSHICGINEFKLEKFKLSPSDEVKTRANKFKGVSLHKIPSNKPFNNSERAFSTQFQKIKHILLLILNILIALLVTMEKFLIYKKKKRKHKMS